MLLITTVVNLSSVTHRYNLTVMFLKKMIAYG